ncbi:MAG: 30S ribosomal protein S17 [Chloroflexota bacterium]|nr:30S ribosomal protein S17 [Chloroflexia bacterium]MDQ3167744.1 30S ribosomal protein S17 [Chloroflexota bacterium]MDQ3512355.1 30S ribosomal protein S17 [Chloroflexota bacterium]
MTDTATTTPSGLGRTQEVHQQHRRAQKVGRVDSNKMDKTVVVTVDYVKRHPLYHKRMTRTSRFFAHDENNLCNQGDLVRIEEVRPLSKKKRWIVREIIERGIQI